MSETAEKIYDYSDRTYEWTISLNVNSIGQLRFGFTNKSPTIVKTKFLFFLVSQNQLVEDLKLIDDADVFVDSNQTKSYDTLLWTFLTTFENRTAFFSDNNLTVKVAINVS